MAYRAPVADKANLDIIFYHAACGDGLAAAWAHSHWALGSNSSVAMQIPVAHGLTRLPIECTGRHVALFDFTFAKELMEQLVRECASLVVIDHHKSAFDTLESVLSPEQYIYDQEHSACMLVWMWLYGAAQPPPLFLSFIEDRDLWRFALPNSKAFNAGLFYGTEWSQMTIQYDDLSGPNGEQRLVELLSFGESCLRVVDKLVQTRAKQAKAYTWDCGPEPDTTLRYRIVNSADHISDLGAYLMKKHHDVDFVCIWDYRAWDGVYHMHLRSNDSRTDTSIIPLVSVFGGGGHPKAGAFSLPLDSPYFAQWVTGTLDPLDKIKLDVQEANTNKRSRAV